MGALVGGALQSVTYVIGIKALLLVVAALYLAALACGPRHGDTTDDNENREDTKDNTIEETLLKTVNSLQATVNDSMSSAGLQPSHDSTKNR